VTLICKRTCGGSEVEHPVKLAFYLKGLGDVLGNRMEVRMVD
jgi:hypothetical protein